MNGLLDDLRAASVALHRQVEAHAAIADVRAPGAGLGAYRRFLQASAAFVVPLERRLRRQLVADGLDAWLPALNREAALQRDGVDIAHAVADAALPTAAPAGASWGHLYVLEGARLGLALLQRELGPTLATDGWSSAYLRAEAPASCRWSQLKDALADVASPTLRRSAVDAACADFRFVSARLAALDRLTWTHA